MKKSVQMPELIAPVASEPEPVQPSRYSAFYPLPPLGAPESTWRDYAVINRFLIQRHLRNWLAHQLQHYVQNQLPGGSIMYDPTLSESENEARWQSDNIRRVEHSMMQFFQPDDYHIVTDVMLRRYQLISSMRRWTHSAT